MPNNFNNTTLRIAEEVLEGFESLRVLSKAVNTQLLNGKFDPDSGTQTDFKRPRDFKAIRTPKGDMTAETASSIITGRASGFVQDYITVFIEVDEFDEALNSGDLRQYMRPINQKIVTTLEVSFAKFMLANSGLLSGVPGTAATKWDDIAGYGAIMDASGVPAGDWQCAINPFTQRKLSSDQRSLGAGGSAGTIITEAHRKAIITTDFAGMDVMKATTLATYRTDADADRAGTVVGAPDATYLTARNTMTQAISVTALGFGAVIPAGETVQITGRNRLNLSTRLPIIDETGAEILFTGTVTKEVTLDGAGAGILIITGPALNEADGQYNTVDSPIADGDIITLLGPADKTIQPNLFWAKDAFSIGSIPIKRLHATDNFVDTEDGLQLRVSQFSNGLANQNVVRVDFHPAFAALNPFYAGLGYGT